MDKWIETVELPGGEIVALGPFHSQAKGQAFAEHISDAPVSSVGGMRLMTVDALARELGVRPALLKPSKA